MSILTLEDDKNNLYEDPLRFIDKLDGKKHIVLYYENPTFGKKIQFRFMRNGLLKGESCIYSIDDNEDPVSIENEMIDNGIDVEKYNKCGLLKIFKIPTLVKYSKDVLKGSNEIIDRMFFGLNLNLPFRMVVRMINELNTKEQIEANLTLEQFYHSKFDRFNGLVLCPYNVNYNPINTNGKWVENILKNHHSAIFITGPEEEGIAFNI